LFENLEVDGEEEGEEVEEEDEEVKLERIE